IVSLMSQDQSYTFARSGPVPDAELWREPSRVLESAPAARRIALSDDGTWILTGSDGGQAALFDPADTLRALPQSFAGMSALAFSDDARFFALGGQTLTFLTAPAGPRRRAARAGADPRGRESAHGRSRREDGRRDHRPGHLSRLARRREDGDAARVAGPRDRVRHRRDAVPPRSDLAHVVRARR